VTQTDRGFRPANLYTLRTSLDCTDPYSYLLAGRCYTSAAYHAVVSFLLFSFYELIALIAVVLTNLFKVLTFPILSFFTHLPLSLQLYNSLHMPTPVIIVILYSFDRLGLQPIWLLARRRNVWRLLRYCDIAIFNASGSRASFLMCEHCWSRNLDHCIIFHPHPKFDQNHRTRCWDNGKHAIFQNGGRRWSVIINFENCNFGHVTLIDVMQRYRLRSKIAIAKTCVQQEAGALEEFSKQTSLKRLWLKCL